ncbi:MAG TPA: hypothetical protein VFI12_04670 [Thermomicrobiales bacterium]|nr:hypothetical protein [Thermomicrobiales bacterium]
MIDLVARLRHAWDERERQLAEDDRVARAAIADDGGLDGGFENATWLTDVRLIKPRFGDDAAAMIRRFAVPRRVLAEVERERRDLAAKRRILDRVEPEIDDGTSGSRIARFTIRALAEAENLVEVVS